MSGRLATAARWLFALAFLAYLQGPSRAGSPEQRARQLLNEAVLAGDGFDLRRLGLAGGGLGDAVAVLPDGRVAPKGPLLATLASLPAAAAIRALYPHVSVEDRARWTGRVAGALWVAAAVALTGATLLALAPPESALLLTACAALATPLWSGASRSDVPEALASFAVAAILWLSLGATFPARFAWTADLGAGALVAVLLFLDPPSLAAPLALALGGRPASSARSPVALVSAALAGCAALSTLQAAAAASADPFLEGRFGGLALHVPAAYLFSPGRGLLLFAPIAVLALVAAWAGRSPGRLARTGTLVLAALLLERATALEPWGPLGFGPTVLAPYVPLLAVMAAGVPRGWLRAGALACLPAALAHGAAVFAGGHTWDERRQAVHDPAAMWDFRDSPWSDLVSGAPRPDPAAFSAVDYVLRPGDYITREGHASPWLAYGWEEPEPKGVWASGGESWIVVAVPPGDYVLTLIASAPRRGGREQRIVVERPGQPPLERAFARALWDLEPIAIPFRAERNLTVLKLRPAHTWMPGKGDVRRCSVFVESLRLEAAPLG